jgi:hypothetical protein
VRCVIKHVTKRLRQHWPNTRIVWRGDSHYGRVEAMEWAEDNGEDYIFGLAGNAPLCRSTASTSPAWRMCSTFMRKSPIRSGRSSASTRARRVLRRLEFHYVPKHDEIGVLRSQCLDRRIATREQLETEIAAWQRQRNASGARIKWMFTTTKARAKMGHAYPLPASARQLRAKES